MDQLRKREKHSTAETAPELETKRVSPADKGKFGFTSIPRQIPIMLSSAEFAGPVIALAIVVLGSLLTTTPTEAEPA